MAESTVSKYPLLDKKTSTESQYRGVFNLIQANPAEAYSISKETQFYTILSRPDLYEVLPDIDSACAEILKTNNTFRLYGFGWACGQLPKTSKLFLQNHELDDDFAYTLEFTRKGKVNILTPYWLVRSGATLEDLIKILSEFMAFPSTRFYMSSRMVQDMKTAIQRKASKEIKRKLREQGKSFVTKNGVNPCGEYLSRLNTALDAPRFEGLNEWLAELNFNARIDESKLWNNEKISKLKDSLYYGDCSMTRFHKALLLVYLGVNGYNQFVQEYNGEK
jgi:hypothetical protein